MGEGIEPAMHRLYAAADFAICRSGAGTTAELIRYCIPALLIPFPFAADDHQRINAEFLAKQIKGGKILLEEWAHPKGFPKRFQALIHDAPLLKNHFRAFSRKRGEGKRLRQQILNLKEYEMTYHFIGMGGIGMSALARILLERGAKVQGSDMKDSPLLQNLAKDGAPGSYRPCQGNPRTGKCRRLQYRHRGKQCRTAGSQKKHLCASSIALISCTFSIGSQKPLLVTGTHGKTTTSALLAAVLLEAGADPSFVVGGIVRSCNTNGRSGKGPYFASEADESDGSFLKTPAFGAIVTNFEKEHMNYWKTEERLKEGFRTFFNQADVSRTLVLVPRRSYARRINPKGVSYGFSHEADLSIQSYAARSRSPLRSSISRSLVQGDRTGSLRPPQCLEWLRRIRTRPLSGIEEAAIRRAFLSFAGASAKARKSGLSSRISKCSTIMAITRRKFAPRFKAMRDRFREKRLVAIVQPHRYSRIRDLIEEFASSFRKPTKSSSPIFTQQEKQRSKARPPRKSISSCRKARRACPLVSMTGSREGQPIFGMRRCRSRIRSRRYHRRRQKYSGETVRAVAEAHYRRSLWGNIRRTRDLTFVRPQYFPFSRSRHLQCEGVRLTKDGHWIFGDDALARLEKHETDSQRSAKLSGEILKNLLSCDVVVPVLHGPQGEDGMVQGLLDALDLPYVGCDYRAAAICMQKAWTKHVAVMNGVPTAPYVECSSVRLEKRKESIKEFASSQFDYPLWVKPVHLGSSIGVSRVLKKEFLDDAVELAFQYDHQILIEKEVDGRQIEFAVLGNDEIRVGAPGEILNHGQFYDFERKYGPQSFGTEDSCRSDRATSPDRQRSRLQHVCGLLLQRTRQSRFLPRSKRTLLAQRDQSASRIYKDQPVS